MFEEKITAALELFVESPTFKKSGWSSDLSRVSHLLPLKNREIIAIHNLDKTLKELGAILSRSKERARQVRFRALLKLLYMRQYGVKHGLPI